MESIQLDLGRDNNGSPLPTDDVCIPELPSRDRDASKLIQCIHQDWISSHFHYAHVILLILSIVNTLAWSMERMITKEEGQTARINDALRLVAILNTCYSIGLCLFIQLTKVNLFVLFSDISSAHANYMQKMSTTFRLMVIITTMISLFRLFGFDSLNILNYIATMIIGLYQMSEWSILRRQITTA